MGTGDGGEKDWEPDPIFRIGRAVSEEERRVNETVEKTIALLRKSLARHTPYPGLAGPEKRRRGSGPISSGGILPMEGEAPEAVPEPDVRAGGGAYRTPPKRPPYRKPPMKKSTKAWVATYIFTNLAALVIVWLCFGVYGARLREAASWVVLGWLVLHAIGFLIRAVDLSDKKL